MYKYKNVSEITQVITASGDINPRVVKPGGETEVSFPLENPNFEYVGTSSQVQETNTQVTETEKETE